MGRSLPLPGPPDESLRSLLIKFFFWLEVWDKILPQLGGGINHVVLQLSCRMGELRVWMAILKLAYCIQIQLTWSPLGCGCTLARASKKPICPRLFRLGVPVRC